MTSICDRSTRKSKKLAAVNVRTALHSEQTPTHTHSRHGWTTWCVRRTSSRPRLILSISLICFLFARFTVHRVVNGRAISDYLSLFSAILFHFLRSLFRSLTHEWCRDVRAVVPPSVRRQMSAIGAIRNPRIRTAEKAQAEWVSTETRVSL